MALVAGCRAGGRDEGDRAAAAAAADRAGKAAREPGDQAARAAPGDARRGELLFGQIGCNGCHLVNGVGGMVGPELTGVASRPTPDPGRWPSAEAYVRASILEPGTYLVPGYTADMPGPDKLGLAPQHVNDLVAYLMTLL